MFFVCLFRLFVGWSPFDGFKFKGTPVSTIIGGKIKMKDGKILGEPEGEPLKFN